MKKAEVQQITDKPIASFDDLPCLLPRGRYGVQVRIAVTRLPVRLILLIPSACLPASSRDRLASFVVLTVQFFPSFLRLHGKSYDYKIAYSTVCPNALSHLFDH